MRPPRRTPVRLLARVAGLAVALPLTLLATSLPAHAEGWSVPSDARITLPGHGYGHGKGMSQYGAQGAARQGLGHRQIIDFYYPGTTWSKTGGWVKVLISADTSDDVVVLARPGLAVRDLADGATTTLPSNGASRWRLVVVDGRDVVQFLDTRWRTWRTLKGRGEFTAGGEAMSLVTPSGTKAYRGRLRAAQPSAGSSARDTVNVVKLDVYLRGVVPLEMPATWAPAAVRAQAVAARTYAAYERAHPRARHYQICDTTSCQVYGGASAEHPDSNAAIAATAGQALTYNGAWAFTQFSSSSGGWTAKGSMPYLTAKQDPYDGWAGNPVHDWSYSFSDNTIEQRFPAIGNLTRIEVNRRDGNGEWGGRVESITFIGGKGRATVSGDTARWRVGLRSTWFTVRVAAN
ncbi:SpoIID/LytB domain-containing protein [Nocardioides rotundus]|uniref:SpoIID/LytB domain-containing protein n=1 Tax=Nocardioides rotundus TaxID=1774216 RepID=UPI001CBC40C8|nr:SpoIID/LytB domain-containing protein [Nocardioides rotundus]UAL28674.1 SpoIID/LytB domain-containing protein [Nocardioides rotundus]